MHLNDKSLEGMNPDDPCFSLAQCEPDADDHPAFAEMLRIAKALPIRHWAKDLTYWDRRALRAPKTATFAWFVRSTGSMLIWASDGGVPICAEIIRDFCGVPYWYDGAVLAPRAREQIVELLRRKP